jgi:hypothetical protein
MEVEAMKFKAGDKVRIREDLKVDKMYGGLNINKQKAEFLGQIATVTHAWKFEYALDADGGKWSWNDEMLESAETPQAPFGFHTGEKLFSGLDDGSASTITNAVKAFHDQADFKDMPPIGIALGNSNEPDMIQKPPHYNKFSFQPIDIITEVTNYYEGSTAFYIGTVLKYLCRAPFKGKLLEDLKRAEYYLKRAIDEMEEEE